MEIFKTNNIALPLRSVGIRAINLKDDGAFIQQDLFGESEKELKIERIEDSVYSVRKKFGSDAVKRGSVIKHD